MMTPLILFLATLMIFAALDAVMLTLVIAPLFRAALGEALLATPRVLTAGLFYLVYAGGLVWLVSLPALRAGDPMQALTRGAVAGFMAYATYELTNHATLRDWTWRMVAVDLAWGTMLTAFAAWAAVTILRGAGC
jgi:uncharacterized membrane protein